MILNYEIFLIFITKILSGDDFDYSGNCSIHNVGTYSFEELVLS